MSNLPVNICNHEDVALGCSGAPQPGIDSPRAARTWRAHCHRRAFEGLILQRNIAIRKQGTGWKQGIGRSWKQSDLRLAALRRKARQTFQNIAVFFADPRSASPPGSDCAHSKTALHAASIR
jgi:hypothetical protein